MILSRIAGWGGAVLLVVLAGRFGWLVQTGDLTFQSDITALLPAPQVSWLVKKTDDRVANEINNRIAIIIQGRNIVQTDAATNRLTTLIEQGITHKKLVTEQIAESEFNLFSARIEAMLAYKDRLIGDRSRRRMQESFDSQLNWRMEQVTLFPPSNVTDPVTDPLGTMEEFLAERLPNISGTRFDGLYLRIDHDTPGNLILINLSEGELGNEQATDSIQFILSARDAVVEEFDVKFYLSGIPLHAMTIKEQTVKEIRWMASLAVVFTLGFFLYITRSVRALLISTATILLAIAGGLVISHETIGLPHLIGLTMATTAVGICIDFSLHFWIHIRTGMSGIAAIKKILPGLNMSFLTTTIGLLVIAFTSIPVLTRSAVFICAVLLVSWLITLFAFPHFAGNSDANKRTQIRRSTLPRRLAIGLTLAITCASGIGLIFKYHADDDPTRLGHQADSLVQDDLIVRNLLGITGQPGVYLMEANSAEALIKAETILLAHLTDEELFQVGAVSRLVVGEEQQRNNQLLFKQAKDGLDTALLEQYLGTLQVPNLDWQSGADKQYALPWVVAQPWASIERNNILTCDQSICASIIRAPSNAAKKLDIACKRAPECSRISLSERQLSVFQKLRSSLAWTLLLAISAIFMVIYFRYRNKAFILITVPVLASVSGIAAVAWAGMPITAFTLAAVLPLLGLSIDYVIFSSESGNDSAPTSMAIFASALTTSLSFWILFFSTTPAVQFFALPIAVGIPVAWISVQIIQPRHV